MRPATADQTTEAPCCTACGQVLGFRTTDRLTGLLDRWAWDEAAVEILEQVGDRPAVLLMLDLDGFREVNNVHGHLAGDVVLRAVASVVRGAVRQMDVVGRYGGYGGDEFLVLLPATDREQGERVASRMLAQIRAVAVAVPSARGGTATIRGLTASVGLAARDHGPDHDLTALFQAADGALRRAKQTGRDRLASAAVGSGTSPFGVRALPSILPNGGGGGRFLAELSAEWGQESPRRLVPREDPPDYATVLAAQLRSLLRMLPGEDELDVLAALSCGPMPYRDMAVTGGSLDAVLDRLERAGLVACDRDGDVVVCCSLTLAARELLDRLLPAMEWAGRISSTGAAGA
ncbi:diguanylate cyclase [Actinophytocola xanthii]|uniref:GGDEF domain-containing protein n=1 Tax=Actinophytocola xanthii TaxID=1912961 RepID=A0A1Q8CPJ8_9PSEU|nr:diguanylate cyclase [Actinophytocola xanthii]OLF16284.1 hypothetical protein BU204_16965 [Actinophytocola xanthii]